MRQVGPGTTPPPDLGYPTSIGYLRRSTVCSEPLVAGPPQWKCSWMVWYTSGRPPPLTDMPVPTCTMTATQIKKPFFFLPRIHRCSGGGESAFTGMSVVLEDPVARLDVLESLQVQRVQRPVPAHLAVQVDGRVVLLQ